MRDVLAMFGGTFDPVHFGHLRPALEVAETLGLKEMRLVPARVPPHRHDPGVSAEHRLAMLERALSGQERLVIDRRELSREGPSYTVDTLASLRQDYPEHALALVVGEDAFASLSSWHRWEELADLAHLVVMTRPGARRVLDAALEDLCARRRVPDAGALREARSGCLLVAEVTPLAISASRIRELLAAGREPRWLLPDRVLDYIREHGLYGSEGGR